jgi:DNA-binding FadR family transcriptional regulator
LRLESLHLVLTKAPGLLADRLRELILAGKFNIGEMLPTERDLVIDSGLSRGSVREALKILETEGLIEIRTGRSGGAMVTTPKRDSLARSVEVFVRANSITLADMLDCRVAAEPTLARLAAQRRTSEELAELRELHKQFAASTDDLPRYRRINFEWHLAIARASRNEPLIALMEAISKPVLDATGFEKFTTPKTRNDAVKAHAAIIEAIAAQDADAAETAMQNHLLSYVGSIDKRLHASQQGAA